MIEKFEMSMMWELKYFLGFQIKELEEGTFICQTKYIQDILKKFGMKNAKFIKTPMGTNGHLDLNTGGKSVDQKVYRSMIRSLLYFCTSRLDIMLSVCMCARFLAVGGLLLCRRSSRQKHLRQNDTIACRSYFQPRLCSSRRSSIALSQTKQRRKKD
jgi:hypothetical protein